MALDDVSSFALAAHLAADGFLTLHLVTGARAARAVSGWLDHDTAQRLAAHMVLAVAVGYAAAGAPPLLDTTELDALRLHPLPSREEIAERAIVDRDPHVIKLANVALVEEQRTADPLYHDTAAHAVSLAPPPRQAVGRAARPSCWLEDMAIRQMDDHLASVIRRSRVRAAELGELTPKVPGPIESAFSPEAQRTQGCESASKLGLPTSNVAAGRMARRRVVFEDEFFESLNAQVPAVRSATGIPSRTDLLAYDIPPLMDLLADDHETSPSSSSRRRRTSSMTCFCSIDSQGPRTPSGTTWTPSGRVYANEVPVMTVNALGLRDTRSASRSNEVAALSMAPSPSFTSTPTQSPSRVSRT